MKIKILLLSLALLAIYYIPVNIPVVPVSSVTCGEESREDYCDNGLKYYKHIP